MDAYRFRLAFDGELIENSVDAFDVANTILATSYALQEISTIQLGDKGSRNLNLKISAFKEGSLITDFLYHFGPILAASQPLLPIAQDIYKVGSGVVGGLKTYIELRKLLKGEKPKKVVAINNQNIELHFGDNNHVTINYNDMRLLQSQTMAKNVEKATQPLRKEDSPLSQIEILEGSKTLVDVKKEEAQYLQFSEILQTLPTMRFKGVITKLDSKVRSGYISVGNKRIPYTYSDELPEDQYMMLAESLKRKLQIFLVGEVTMDYESNPRSIIVQSIESEIKLL